MGRWRRWCCCRWLLVFVDSSKLYVCEYQESDSDGAEREDVLPESPGPVHDSLRVHVLLTGCAGVVEKEVLLEKIMYHLH